MISPKSVLKSEKPLHPHLYSPVESHLEIVFSRIFPPHFFSNFLFEFHKYFLLTFFSFLVQLYHLTYFTPPQRCNTKHSLVFLFSTLIFNSTRKTTETLSNPQNKKNSHILPTGQWYAPYCMVLHGIAWY